MQVAPGRDAGATQDGEGRQSRRQLVWVACRACYNIGICVLLLAVLFAQVFGIIWSSATIPVPIHAGRSPLLGLYTIPGFNDEPYSDRAVACVKQGQYFQPIQLSKLLKQQSSASTTGQWKTNGVDGYRVVSRDSFSMDATSFSYYVQQCSAVLRTLESIFTACEKLGYNITKDVLRIADGVNTTTVSILPHTLPVFVLPYWDMGNGMRYAAPGHDGSACVFRTDGIFTSEVATTVARLRAVNRTIREARTAEWLGYRGGVWRNGWYDDPVVHMRWYSDIISSIPNGKYNAPQREFDLLDGAREIDCSVTSCGGGEITMRWDDEIASQMKLGLFDSVAIANGSRFGLFQYEAQYTQTIVSRYNIGKLLSNACFLVLIARWITAIVALYPVDSIGIGALSNSSTFHFLPLLLLPRLKSALTGFWTFGCRFEGPQFALESAWFEIYPAIGEIVMLLFCVLNTAAKLTRRRMSDVLFGPTLLFFCFFHYFRFEITSTGMLGVDSRIPTIVTASELEAASAWDYFATDLPFRVDAEAKIVFRLKLAVLGINLLPLLLGSHRVVSNYVGAKDLPVERALAMQCGTNAGLGSTGSPYTVGKTAAHPYEIVRLGYIVVGSSRKVLISVDHWFWLLLGNRSRRFSTLMFRVALYEIDAAHADSSTNDAIAETASLSLTLVETTSIRLDHLAITTIGSQTLC